MSKASRKDKQALLRALVEARDYLEFSAEKADFSHTEYYLAVRNFLEQTIKEIESEP